MDREEHIAHLEWLLRDPDMPRFFSDKQITEMEAKLKELKAEEKK